MNLTDMWRRLRKALGVPLIEEPETKIILPIKSAGMITGIDMGDGKDTSAIFLAPGPSVGLKYGSSPLENSGGLLNKEQSDRFVNLLKKANDKMLPKPKWTVMTDDTFIAPREHDTVEEALRHRHSAPRGADPSIPLEKRIMQSLTEAVAKDIDKTILGNTIPYIPQMRMLTMPRPMYGSAGLKAKFATPRDPHETIEEALRMRHRKTGIASSGAPLFSTKDIVVQPIRVRTTFFPLLDKSIDKLWVK